MHIYNNNELSYSFIYLFFIMKFYTFHSFVAHPIQSNNQTTLNAKILTNKKIYTCAYVQKKKNKRFCEI